MKAILKQVNDCPFVGQAESNHWIAIDTQKEVYGIYLATKKL